MWQHTHCWECSRGSNAGLQVLTHVLCCAAWFAGNGAHEDIVVSSARAYISALNKMISWMSSANKVQSRSMKSVDGSSVKSVDAKA